ncbi:stage III sporulation protein AF [Paenibacillus sp. FA6]|uniref:stage III sporulation protein AF n=1 Tax=Paenibacillus sp. FA6 TaxID=3413029 RepID=UPI003F65BFAD
MAWLNEWMREVIMVVLLATFVDLILPSRSMERYVKLVLSLLVLLTLMQPIINLLTDSPEVKLSAAFQNQDVNAAYFTNGKESTLQQILAQGEKIQHQQQTQSLQWAGEEVARQMKVQIESKTGKQVQEVKVLLTLPPMKEKDEQASPSITSVDVVLLLETEDSQGQPDQDHSQQIAVAPIAPVKVEVNVEPVEAGNGQSDGRSTGTSQSDEASAQLINGAEDIQKLLSSEWNLKAEQIRILVNEEDAKV